MKLRKNRKTERAAVNAVRTFFEANNCVFQEVDIGNDYGKDAYVDYAVDSNVTGICFAVQIKGGASYKSSKGYIIPLDAAHAKVWAQSTIPIIGIVYDPIDKMLRWCNISKFLEKEELKIPSKILINKSSVLTPTSLRFELITSLYKFSKRNNNHPLLGILSKAEHIQMSSLYDCFALGRSDPRILIALRYLLMALEGEALLLAIRLLSHVTPHPDIWWSADNWIMADVKKEVQSHLSWDINEILYLLSAIPWELWERGNTGEDLYMILLEDPNIRKKMTQTAYLALDQGKEEAAFMAFYLSIYWAGKDGVKQLNEMIEAFPNFLALPLVNEVKYALENYGYIALF